MPLSYPYIQYGGIWTTSQATDAVAAGTWAVPPAPHLLAWGQNFYGPLGIGNETNYSSPKQVGSLTNWLVLSAGQYASAAIKSDGTLWVWGINSSGELGLGNTTNYSSPKQVGSLTTWKYVTSGRGFMAAIKTDGTLWTWGGNAYGVLGLGNTTAYSSPKQVGALTDWDSVSSGVGYWCFARKTAGTIWSWGFNTYGQLGLGNSGFGTNRSSPVQIGALTNWLSISSGSYNGYAIKTDGTLWAWGNNANGSVGVGNTTSYSSPKQVGSLTDWLSSAGGQYFGVFTKTNGTLWSVGANFYGQLGLGDTVSRSSPTQVGSLTSWLKISAGGYRKFSMAIKTDGTLWSWGWNNLGQLGLGNITSYSSPKQVGSLATWQTISCGQGHSLAIAKT